MNGSNHSVNTQNKKKENFPIKSLTINKELN